MIKTLVHRIPEFCMTHWLLRIPLIVVFFQQGMNTYIKRTKEFGDVITRFSGITIASIMTGVIWTGEPESFWDVLWYDNLHVLLWVGGMYFALRGNRT